MRLQSWVIWEVCWSNCGDGHKTINILPVIILLLDAQGWRKICTHFCVDATYWWIIIALPWLDVHSTTQYFSITIINSIRTALRPNHFLVLINMRALLIMKNISWAGVIDLNYRILNTTFIIHYKFFWILHQRLCNNVTLYWYWISHICWSWKFRRFSLRSFNKWHSIAFQESVHSWMHFGT